MKYSFLHNIFKITIYSGCYCKVLIFSITENKFHPYYLQKLKNIKIVINCILSYKTISILSSGHS